MLTPTGVHRTAMLAYQIWEQQGRPPGRELENWYQAERQLEVEFRVGFPDASSAAAVPEIAGDQEVTTTGAMI